MNSETQFRDTFLDKLEKRPNLWLDPYYGWSLDFYREFGDHAIPRDHYFWRENKPMNEEQEKIWKEFGPKNEWI